MTAPTTYVGTLDGTPVKVEVYADGTAHLALKDAADPWATWGPPVVLEKVPARRYAGTVPVQRAGGAS